MAQARWQPAAIADDLGLKVAKPIEAERTLRRAARFQAALWDLFETRLRSRCDRRQRDRLSLRRGDGRRAAEAYRRRP